VVDVSDDAKVARVFYSHEKTGIIVQSKRRVNLKLLLRRKIKGLFDWPCGRSLDNHGGMSESDPAQRPDESVPKFRVNAQVFQILGLLAVALALPITILVLGLIGMRKDRLNAAVETRISDSTAEVPGLRQSLESIAEVNLPIAPVETPMRVFRLRLDLAEKSKKKRLELLDLLKQSNAGFVETGDSTQPSWIVTIESSRVALFENDLIRMGFLGERTGEGSETIVSDAFINQSVLYKVYLEGAP
jgi:hypothetical protein